MSQKHGRRTSLTNAPGRKTGKRGSARYLAGRSEQLRPGESIKFMLPIDGTDEECFLINFRGEFHAYVNRCRHVPMAMDWVDNQFFSEQSRYLKCQTHEAYYEPATGRCVAGPSSAGGKFLYRVPIEISDGMIYARVPKEKFED